MAGRLFFPFPLSSSHTPPRVYYCLLPPLLSACLLFPSLASSSRLAAYEGTYGWRHCTTSPSFCLPTASLCANGGSSFSSIAFGYRGINYPLVPSVHYLPLCTCPLEIVREKRIPFSPIRTLHSCELLVPSTCPVAVWWLEGSVPSIHCFLISFCFT